MIHKMVNFYNVKAEIYYFDMSYEETVKRHNSRSKKTEFGEGSLRACWNPKDYLGLDGEILLTDGMSQDDVMKLMLNQLQK